MNCKKINKLLPLYVSGDLDAPRIEEVEAHLAECLPCNREFQSYSRSLDSLRELGDKPDLSLVLDGFSDEIMRKIENDEGGVAAQVPRVTYSSSSYFSGSHISRSLAAAALVLVLISAGIYLLRPGAGGSDPESGKPGNNFAHESVSPGQPGMNTHGVEPEVVQPSRGPGQPFLVSGDFTTVDPAARTSENGPSAEEEPDEPYLDPLPHKFPRVQPVEYKRDF